MIHNSSSDPVLIKKISIKIWSLRDEIETRIQEKMNAGEIVPESLEQNLKELREQYTPKKSANVIGTIGNNPLPAEEDDEMARAMAEAMNGEESTEEVTENSDDEKTEIPDNVVSLNTKAPEIEVHLAPPPIDESKISKGKTVLSEISMEKMFFFSNKAFTEGQSIVIQFCIPKTFIVNADVLYCRPFNIKSRVISQNNYTHRMLVKFNFLKEGERALLRQFIQSIEPDVQRMVKKEDSDSGEGNESGFDELDDLGL